MAFDLERFLVKNTQSWPLSKEIVIFAEVTKDYLLAKDKGMVVKKDRGNSWVLTSPNVNWQRIREIEMGFY
jgi:hypothetical protein